MNNKKFKNTSIWYLKEKEDNKPIATLELYIHPYGPSVRSVIINDEFRLPERIKKIIKLANVDMSSAAYKNDNSSLKQIFQAFLNERIPNRKDSNETDQWVMKQLGLRKDALQIGRLTPYCGFIAIKNYFQSEDDDYWIKPEKKQTYYFGYTERGFVNIYEIE